MGDHDAAALLHVRPRRAGWADPREDPGCRARLLSRVGHRGDQPAGRRTPRGGLGGNSLEPFRVCGRTCAHRHRAPRRPPSSRRHRMAGEGAASACPSASSERCSSSYERSRPWFDIFRPELNVDPALREGEAGYWLAISQLYARVFGEALGDDRVRGAVFGLTAPSTFVALPRRGHDGRRRRRGHRRHPQPSSCRLTGTRVVTPLVTGDAARIVSVVIGCVTTHDAHRRRGPSQAEDRSSRSRSRSFARRSGRNRPRHGAIARASDSGRWRGVPAQNSPLEPSRRLPDGQYLGPGDLEVDPGASHPRLLARPRRRRLSRRRIDGSPRRGR